jgi:hypothetical protein
MSRNSFLSFALSMIVVAVGLAASFMPTESASELLTRARQTFGALPKNMETAEFPVMRGSKNSLRPSSMVLARADEVIE